MAKPYRRSVARSWLIMIPAALLVAALGYWNLDADDPRKALPAGSEGQTIDFYMTRSHTLQLNDEGLVHYEFNAGRIDHVQQTDVSLMTEPDLQLYRGTDYPWHIRGERGESGPDGKEIQLFDNVRVERIDAQERPFLLTTEHLTYLPDTDHAFTQLPVQIDSAQGVTTATGMNAFLKKGTVSLLSTVRGRYETE